MFHYAATAQPSPKYLSTVHAPLVRFHLWPANPRVIEIDEVKSVPTAPDVFSFIKRLIGAWRRENLDRTFLWNAGHSKPNLAGSHHFYNYSRAHRSREGVTPIPFGGTIASVRTTLAQFSWRQQCRDLFQNPAAA